VLHNVLHNVTQCLHYSVLLCVYFVILCETSFLKLHSVWHNVTQCFLCETILHKIIQF